MVSTHPLVCVVVITYNSKRFWPRLHAALSAQTFKAWRLLVVDNASDPNERLAKGEMPEGATLVQLETNLGFAAANNLAARLCDTRFIALINPDAFPEPAWLGELVAAAERWPNAAAIGSRQLLADNPRIADGDGDEMFLFGFPYRGAFLKRLPSAHSEGPSFSACAAAALYHAEDFAAVGGFDELFFSYCEDVDLGYRMRLRGRISVQAPGAIVHHVGGGSAARTSTFADFHGRRNRTWVLIKNAPPVLLWTTLLPHLFLTLASLTKDTLTGRGSAGWRGLAAAFADLGALMDRRRVVQSERVVSSWTVAQAMIWSPLAASNRRSKRGER